MTKHEDLKKLLWRCRRGTKELDVILQRFVNQHYIGLDQSEKLAFQDLLDVEDPVLANWLCFQEQPSIKEFDQGVVKIVERILSTY